MLGGAIGDALGYPVEFVNLKKIIKIYGENGIQTLEKTGEISDDTQMTLFTAEGLLRAESKFMKKGNCHIPSLVHHAYLRWLHTQGEENQHLSELFGADKDDGWLIKLPQLYHRRAPGMTCLSALHNPVMGTIENPLNNSKGCGGVMRVAPVGLLASDPFNLGCEIAAITHGHPSGYLSAGVFAYIINHIISGSSVEYSVREALQVLKTRKDHLECLECIQLALDLYEKSPCHQDNIRKIGEGWVAEEAIAISIYCALAGDDDFRKGVCLAVNHDGDSDSTGAITGNILGAYLGQKAIPEEWLNTVELRSVIEELANDLLVKYRDDENWQQKYPGS